MRWVSYGVIVLLVDALVILFWAAKGLPDLSTWPDPWVMGDLALRVPVMGLCVLIWVIYLGLGLLPRLRGERESAAFKKFRAEMKAADEEKRALGAMGGANSRSTAELPKPRTNAKPATLTPKRHWRQHPPGG
jgi:type VI protein secretion system component VasK